MRQSKLNNQYKDRKVYGMLVLGTVSIHLAFHKNKKIGLNDGHLFSKVLEV